MLPETCVDSCPKINSLFHFCSTITFPKGLKVDATAPPAIFEEETKISRATVFRLIPSPDHPWMKQMARNMTLAGIGFLRGCKYLLHVRDTKFCSAFDAILEAVGIQAIKLPPRSPNLNAYCERWIRSVKTELLSRMILIGERSLPHHCLENYMAHFHAERNHQGKDNVILFSEPEDHLSESTGSIQTRERLGGLLKFYYREAA